MTTSPVSRLVSQHGIVVRGTGACIHCRATGLVWVVHDKFGGKPKHAPLLVHAEDDRLHSERCGQTAARAKPPAPSQAEALHAAHVLRDYLRAMRDYMHGPLREAGDAAFYGVVAWVSNLPPGDGKCPLCSVIVRDGKPSGQF